MTWDFLVEQMGASRRLSPSTLLYYRRALRGFSQHFPGLRPLEVEESHLSEFFLALKRAPQLSENTAGMRLRAVLTVLRWSQRRGLLLVNPGQDLHAPKGPRPIPAILSREQVRALLEAPLGCKRIFIRYRDRALLELLYANGMRVGEVSALNLEDVDLADSLVKIRGGKGKPRCTPLNGPSLDCLRAYFEEARPAVARPEQQAVFLTMGGERMSAKSLSCQLNRYGKMLEIPGVTPHALRRALATHLLENGANIVDIKNLLGHADLSSTQFYAQVRPVEMLSEHRRYHPRSRRRKGNYREA